MNNADQHNNAPQILQDLLETNIRQRSDVGESAMKVGLRETVNRFAQFKF